MSELEQVLHSLRGELEFPPTPDVRNRVLARLVERRRAGARVRLVVAMAVVAVALSSATALIAAPSLREAVLETFHLGGGVTVERVRTLPPLSGAQRLRPGREVSLEVAERSVPFEVVVPEALGPPDAVYISMVLRGGEVNLVYAERPRVRPLGDSRVAVLLSEFGTAGGRELVVKLVDEAREVQRLQVEGDEALWIEGPHLFFYRPSAPGSRAIVPSARLAGNVLVVQRDDSYVRIETALPQAEAIRIASSLTTP